MPVRLVWPQLRKSKALFSRGGGLHLSARTKTNAIQRVDQSLIINLGEKAKPWLQTKRIKCTNTNEYKTKDAFWCSTINPNQRRMMHPTRLNSRLQLCHPTDIPTHFFDEVRRRYCSGQRFPTVHVSPRDVKVKRKTCDADDLHLSSSTKSRVSVSRLSGMAFG